MNFISVVKINEEIKNKKELERLFYVMFKRKFILC